MKVKTIGYWACTALLAFMLLTSGAGHLAGMKESAAGIMQLGYPAYFVTLLGVWKVLGGITILAPRLPRLKEWAYAGAIFDLTSAAVSHIMKGNPTFHAVAPLVIAGIALGSWALRPESRRLGSILPLKAG